jgi:sporulation protein YlmC with PRC-barrel domain
VIEVSRAGRRTFGDRPRRIRPEDGGEVTLASEVEGSRLTGPAGFAIGTLQDLLLHPSGEPVVVGAAVRPPATLVVVERRETYVPLSALRFSADGVTTLLEKLPKVRASADVLGFDPDLTVIWTGMPIADPSGVQVGIVGDFGFDPGTGAVTSLVADGGAVASAAYGKLGVPMDALVGYSRGAVRISVGAPELEASGGVAKAAAAAVVGASESLTAVGEIAGNAVVKASGATGRAIKAVGDANIAERAVKRAGKTWSDSVKAFREGMNGEE